MRKNKATRFFQFDPMGSLARLYNGRVAMSNLKSDAFRYNNFIQEVGSVHDLDFDNRYCFIVNATGKAFEVDSLEEAKKLFSNI
jgi:hypothetical protein